MKPFLDENFLLFTPTSINLYHEFAKDLPILDYHNHLATDQIAEDINFSNLTQAWLNGDHYKWRAMRANGVDESFITGDKNDSEKFLQWAKTVPSALRNPLYHWTHLELQRYFGIRELLNEKNAHSIYENCNEKLQTADYSVRKLLQRSGVKLLCTTDDPVDSLEHHQKIASDNFKITVLPTFRPDKAMQTENIAAFNKYVNRLEKVSNIDINSYPSFLTALRQRHDFFASVGCKLSDHGVDRIYADDYTENEIVLIFAKARAGKTLTTDEADRFKSAMLYVFAQWNFEKGWAQQYHLGAMRNNNSRMLQKLGPDTGWDSMGDLPQAKSLARFLDRLDNNNQLAKTILYNLNPCHNEVVASMAGNFNDGSVAGKIQFGAAWWFLDQKDGMVKQLNALSNIGLLSRFIGMLTDSRSFLSFPRHEYFRRILCNLLGNEMEQGELPGDISLVGKIVKDICYYNCLGYFGWSIPA